MSFQSKVAGIIKIKVNILEVFFVSMRASLRENVIILSVNNKSWWLMFAEVELKFWIKRHVILVVIEHAELNFIVLRACQVTQINLPIIGADLILAGSRTVGVLPFKALE